MVSNTPTTLSLHPPDFCFGCFPAIQQEITGLICGEKTVRDGILYASLMLQCVAACCSVLQRDAACCSVLQRVAAFGIVLQYERAVREGILYVALMVQCVAECCSMSEL